LYTLVKKNNKIYYITLDENFDMYILDLNTNVKKKMKIQNVDEIIPSPDGNQILIYQSTDTGEKLHVADSEGNILRTIAEGEEITRASWSPDQMMIAYQLGTIVNGVNSRDIYIYDVLAGESTRIAVNYSLAEMVWSPSGDRIAVSQLNDIGFFNPSIFYLREEKYQSDKGNGIYNINRHQE